MSEFAPELAEFQTRILDAICDGAPMPDGLVAAHPDRIAIYRDTFLMSLIESLEEVFEVTRAVMGEEAFRALGRDYVRATPLRSGDRNRYGAGLSPFVASHAAFSDHSWISELAALEWALNHAHHADDSEPAGFDQLLSDLPVTLAPSAQVLDLRHDAFGLFQAFHENRLETFALETTTQTRLIWRTPEDVVLSRSLGPLEAGFIDVLGVPAPLAVHLSGFAAKDFPALQAFVAETVPQGLYRIFS